MDIFQEARDQIEDPDDAEILLQPSPPPSPVHQPEQPAQPEQVPPVHQPRHRSPNRRARGAIKVSISSPQST